MHTQLIGNRGPIAISALSLCISFHCLQPLALTCDPTFSLLAGRGIGKIALILMVLVHCGLLVASMRQSLARRWCAINVQFFGATTWLRSFAGMFLLFALLHAAMLVAASQPHCITIDSQALTLIPSKLGSLFFGLVTVFFLAWTEELIFRGTIFFILSQRLSVMSSMLITSGIFALSHNLINPLAMVISQWRLGLGLFLLGLFLNTLFVATGTLAYSMGAHAGLVYIKVILRRIPLIAYTQEAPWWFNADLRQCLVVQALFFIGIVGMLSVLQRTRGLRQERIECN